MYDGLKHVRFFYEGRLETIVIEPIEQPFDFRDDEDRRNYRALEMAQENGELVVAIITDASYISRWFAAAPHRRQRFIDVGITTVLVAPVMRLEAPKPCVIGDSGARS